MTWKVFIHYGYFSKSDFDEQLIQSSFYQAVVATLATNQVTRNCSEPGWFKELPYMFRHTFSIYFEKV
jgi:hypothetical protein